MKEELSSIYRAYLLNSSRGNFQHILEIMNGDGIIERNAVWTLFKLFQPSAVLI